MGYIGSDPKTKESVSTSQLVDDSVTNPKIVDDIQFNSVTASFVSSSTEIVGKTFTGTFSGALSSSAQIGASISGSFTSPSSSLSTRVTAVEAGSTSKTLVSSSVLSSPSQGTIRLATNGVNTDVDSGLQTGDSPTFNAITVSTATVTGTLTAQEVHTEFESASILFTSGSTQFGNSSDDVHEFKGNVISGSSTSTASLAMISLADKIEHIGDTNNTIEFGTDEIKLRTGGGSRLIARDSNVELYNDLVVAGAATFNEDSGDKDFRVESNGNTHMLFVDGGNNRVGVGTSGPSKLFHVEGSTGGDFLARIKNTDGTNGEGLGILTANTSATSRLLHIENDDGRVFTIFNDAKVLIGNNDGFSSASSSLHIAQNEPNIILQDMNHAPASSVALNANSSVAGLEIGADVQNKYANTIISFQLDGAEAARFDSDKAFSSNTTGHYSLFPSSNNTSFVTYGFSGDQNTGMYRLDADSLGFATNATNRLTIRDDGTIFQGTNGSNLSKNTAHAFNVAAAYPWISNFAYNGYPAMQMYRSNNSTVGSHTATADSDIIGVMNWYGSTSSAHKLAASIDVRQSGSMGSYYTPSRMDFYAAYDDENFGVSQPVFSITGPGFEDNRLMGVGTKVPTSKFHVENATNRSVRYVGLIKNYGDASGGPINIIKCNVPRDANGLGYSIVFNLNVTAQVGQGANHASIRTSNVSVALARAGANSGGDGTDTASSVVVDTSAYSEVGSAGSSGGLTITTSNSGATSGTQTVYIRAAISGDGGTGAYILVSGWASGHDDITFESA